MSNHSEPWQHPQAEEEPATLQEELLAPVEDGEEYRARSPRQDLAGEAAEADVLDQAAVAWDEEEEPDVE